MAPHPALEWLQTAGDVGCGDAARRAAAAPPARHNGRPSPSSSFLLSNLLRSKNSGVAYTGKERAAGAAQVVSVNSLASAAYQAALRAQDAERLARQAAEEAGEHELVAMASAGQAKAALLQAEQTARAAAASSPALKPLIRFCADVAKDLQAHPKRANRPDALQLRAFCGGLDAYLDRTTRVGGSTKTPDDLGFRLYQMPPQEYPKYPIWAPSVPQMQAPMEGPEPSVPASIPGAASAASVPLVPPPPGLPLPERQPPVARRREAQARSFLWRAT